MCRVRPYLHRLVVPGVTVLAFPSGAHGRVRRRSAPIEGTVAGGVRVIERALDLKAPPLRSRGPHVVGGLVDAVRVVAAVRVERGVGFVELIHVRVQ